MSYRPPTLLQRTMKPARLLRALATLLEYWPWYLLIFGLLSPVSPNLRVVYSYIEYGGYQHMTKCTYLGNRGLIEYTEGSKCPLVVVIDRRETKF